MALDLTRITNTTEIVVRYSDSDVMGVVHYSRYLIYFEDGFMSFLKALGSSPTEHLFPIAESRCIYKESARFGDVLEVITQVEKITTHSLTCKHEIRRKSDKHLLAHGTIIRVCYSMEQKKIPLSDILPLVKR